MGVFLVCTAIVIAIPVVSELLEGGRRLRELASPTLLAIGLFAAGVAFWFVSPERELQVAWAGVVVALVGLLLRPADAEAVEVGKIESSASTP